MLIFSLHFINFPRNLTGLIKQNPILHIPN
jgi:hypothetical protein